MKISMNPIGNYSAIQRKPVAEIKQTPKPPANNEIISQNEKQFFAGKYPDKKEEIVDYHFYQKSGQMSGVSVGTLVNRRA